MISQEEWKEIYELFLGQVEGGAMFPERIVEALRLKASVEPPPGHWYGHEEGMDYQKMEQIWELQNKLINGDGICLVCDEDKSHGHEDDCHAAPAAMINLTYSYKECIDRLEALCRAFT